MKMMECRCFDKLTDFSPFLLRVVTGIVFLYHGYLKWQGGAEQFAAFLGSLSVPAPMLFAWVVIVVEILGGLALIAGFWTHWAAKLLAVDMLVAVLLFHLPNGFLVNQGGFEFALLLFAVLLYFATAGPGKWSMEKI